MITPTTLPDPNQLRSLMQSLATLDAINCPEWEFRYHSFNAEWGEGEAMGSIRNGSGDEVFALFGADGCFVKGFAHEYPVNDYSVEQFYSGVPECLLSAREEPAFTPDNVSFCCWRNNDDASWSSGIPDTSLNHESFFLIQTLDNEVRTYQEFASDYFENVLSETQIRSIYHRTAMTHELARAINPQVDYAELVIELREIDYPVAQ